MRNAAREVTFLPSTDTFTMVEFDYGTLEHRLRELAFLNSGVRIVLTDARHADVKTQELLYAGRAGRVRQISRSRQEAADPGADRHPRRARRHHGRGRDVVERQLPRECAGLHQQHPAARRRHASGRLPRRADAAGDRLWRILRPDQEGKGGADRRRLPRRADGGAVGQGSGSEIFLADQGQAGLVRSAAGRGKPGQRGARHLARRASGRRQGHHRQGHSGRGGARGGAQGARDHSQRCHERHRRCPANWPIARKRTRQNPKSSSSRAIRPAARPRAGARGRTRRSCRCAARSSMSSAFASIGCCRPR